MPKLGRLSVPVIPLSKCIALIRQASTILKTGVTRENLAQAWGLSANSGWFNQQIAALRLYGLVEGRGKLRLTSLAERLLYPVGDEELLEAKRDAWLNVEIIRLLYERLEGEIPENDGLLMALLQDITEERRDKIHEHLQLVKSLYEEAVRDLQATGLVERKKGTELPSALKEKPSEVVELRMGDVRIWLPPTQKAISMARNLLDAFEKSLEEEEPRKGEASSAESSSHSAFFRERTEQDNDVHGGS